jgi:hypothetical protein
VVLPRGYGGLVVMEAEDPSEGDLRSEGTGTATQVNWMAAADGGAGEFDLGGCESQTRGGIAGKNQLIGPGLPDGVARRG